MSPAEIRETLKRHLGGMTLMEKRVHFLLSCWIASHVGHAVLSTFYEKPPMVFIVPILYIGLILLAVAAWKRNRRAVRSCAILGIATLIIQGLFIWKRDPYGSVSTAVLVFDILAVAASVTYLLFFFSPYRERYLARAD